MLNARVAGKDAGKYVGRGSEWGNDVASHLPGTKAREHVDTRPQAIALWWQEFRLSGMLERVGELAGRDLVCWCAPAMCHADLLLRVANADDPAAEAAVIDVEMSKVDLSVQASLF